MNKFKRHDGYEADRSFTLIEVLMVITIMTILLSLLLPTLNQARATAKRISCLSNLHQMGIAVNTYVQDYNDSYPISYYFAQEGITTYAYSWDLTTIMVSGQITKVIPGLLWNGRGTEKIQQCPAFEGNANWQADPYTGYNYNTSYIGHGEYEAIIAPSRMSVVGHPSHTALFGDGQWIGGANKMMRAPWPNPGDETFNGRWAGTQGYRHSGKTNVAFCDGHSESQANCFVENEDGAYNVAPGTGFLSKDNHLYDLE
jgi:prepilin-type processing-associated H-X9-DG protein